jgi:3-methyl-2-oxobutanoate hydroxymethyltransferase
MKKKKTVTYLYEKKAKGEKITRTVLYDYQMARIAEAADIDVINVGDTVAEVLLGYDNTLGAKLDIMIELAKAVRKGAPSLFIIGDMPFLSYQVSISEAIKNAGRYLQEANMDCVKIEGGIEVVELVRALTNASIPVIAHTGLTPQSVLKLGGYKYQGRNAKTAFEIINTCDELEKAGAIAINLETVPREVAKIIHERTKVPLFGTGTGPYTDAPNMNLYDMLGFNDKIPLFAKRYGNLKEIAISAAKKYVEEARTGIFPGPEHSVSMPEDEHRDLLKMLSVEK